MIKKFFKRTWKLFLNPDEAFHFIKAEHITNNFLLRYIAVVSLFTVIGHIIRETMIGVSVEGLGNTKIPLAYSLVGNIIYLVLLISIAFLSSSAIKSLAPYFNSIPSFNKSLKLMAYVMTPLLIAGIFNILPYAGAIILLLAAAYSVYLLHIGLPVLLETTKDKLAVFTLAAASIWLLLHLLVWYLVIMKIVIPPYL